MADPKNWHVVEMFDPRNGWEGGDELLAFFIGRGSIVIYSNRQLLVLEYFKLYVCCGIGSFYSEPLNCKSHLCLSICIITQYTKSGLINHKARLMRHMN